MASLIVIPFIPASNAPQAGHRLAFEAVKKLVASGPTHLVLLLKRAESLPDELVVLCSLANITVVVVGRSQLLAAWLARPWLYPRLLTRYSNQALKVIQALADNGRFDTIRLEFSQTFPYAIRLKDSMRGQAKILMVVHDLQTQVVSRQSSVEYWLLPWVLRSERRLMDAADEVVVLSEKDKVLASSFIGFAGPVRVEAPTLSAFTRGFRRDPDRVEKNSLLFWGAMGRSENEESVLRFCSEVLDPLRRDGFPFKLYIVGSSPGPRVLNLASEHCVVTGFVDDPTPYFARCEIGVVPLIRGAGIKLKTLEMLACKLRIVATPVGAEGIEAESSNMIVCPFDDFKRTLAGLYVAN